MGQTVNLLVFTFGGSNPSSPRYEEVRDLLKIEKGIPFSLIAIGIPDIYLSQGTQKELRAECSLTKEGIKATILKELKKISKKD